MLAIRGSLFMFRHIGLLLISLASVPAAAMAQDVRITQDLSAQMIDLNGTEIVISRIQDQDHQLEGEFTRTSRPCPPFCITPITVAPGVETIGELEVISFLQDRVSAGDGLLLDSRLPDFFVKGTIPGAVNLPFATLDASNPYRDDILRALGAVNTGGGWDFAQAKTLALFCNGAWCDQAPRALRHLLAAGYPADKLLYYRGGMQSWLQLGLTAQIPTEG